LISVLINDIVFSLAWCVKTLFYGGDGRSIKLIEGIGVIERSYGSWPFGLFRRAGQDAPEEVRPTTLILARCVSVPHEMIWGFGQRGQVHAEAPSVIDSPERMPMPQLKHAPNARRAVFFVAAIVATATGLLACQARHEAVADAYFRSDAGSFGKALVVQPVDQGEARTFPIPRVMAADMQGTHICAVDLDRKLWSATYPSGSIDDLGGMPGGMSPSEAPLLVRADIHGQCFFARDATHLGIGQAGHATRSLAIRGDAFAWTGMDYVPALDMLAIVGGTGFAVVGNVATKPDIATVKVHGQVRGMTVDALSCCAKLSPDGRTLYARAETGDAYLTGHDVIGAFDTATGEFKRVYIPHLVDLKTLYANCAVNAGASEEAQANCRKEADGRLVEVEDAKGRTTNITAEPHDFDLSPDGTTLYVSVITGIPAASEDGDTERSQLVAIDTRSGQVTPLPISPGAHFGTTASGKYLIADGSETIPVMAVEGSAKPPATYEKNDVVRAYALPEAKTVRVVPGEALIGTVKQAL
jgi:hypothetical protein